MFKHFVSIFAVTLCAAVIGGCGSDGGGVSEFKTVNVSMSVDNPFIVADAIENETWEDTDSNSATPDVLTDYEIGAPDYASVAFGVAANTSTSTTTSDIAVESVTVTYVCKTGYVCPAIGPYTYSLGQVMDTSGDTIPVLVMPVQFKSANDAAFLAGAEYQWDVTLSFRVREVSTNEVKTMTTGLTLSAYNEAG